jgi:UDP-galactose transporter B1
MMNDTFRFVGAALGVYVCYFLYGIVQETITQGRYGDKINDDGTVGERYTFTLTMVTVQCYLSCALAKGFPNRD